MLRITSGRGFQLTFANGWTASVQFGTMNYCDNKQSSPYSETSDVQAGEAGCVNAEIAAWDANGKWVTFEDEQQVNGWVSADEVAQFLAEIAAK